MILTSKQEAFAMKYVECGNASEAYRHAYEVSEETKPESIWTNASQTLSDAKVAQRVMELQEDARQRHDITIDKLTDELEEARLQAKNDAKGASAHVAAIMGKAKLHGLITDRKDHILSTGNQNGPTEILIVDATEDTIAAQNRED